MSWSINVLHKYQWHQSQWYLIKKPVKSHTNEHFNNNYILESFFLSFLNWLIFENIFSTIQHHCSNRQQTTMLNKAESFFSIVFVLSLFLVYRTTGTMRREWLLSSGSSYKPTFFNKKINNSGELHLQSGKANIRTRYTNSKKVQYL